MSNRRPYSYAVLRYTHDTSTGEFVNVGLVVFSKDSTYLRFDCKSTVGRVSSMFPNLNSSAFKALLHSIRNRFRELEAENSSRLNLWSTSASIEDVLVSALPIDDSSLTWSPISFGVTSNIEVSFGKIFSRLVSKFDHRSTRSCTTDDDVWRKFRRDLERRNLHRFFGKKNIAGKDDEVEFPFAWKNGIWHCVEPISFDLNAPESIRDKAHKWLGQITSVTDSSEKFKVYLVLAKPKEDRLSPAFDKAVSILEKAPVEREIYLDSDIGVLVDKLSRQVNDHGSF